MKIGVAIPTYNVLPFVETCLSSVHNQLGGVCARAYIADDRSDDGTWEFLEDRPTWYQGITRNHDRLGWPSTLNAAVSLALADGCGAVFTLNADDFLRLDCLVKLENVLISGGSTEIVVPWTQQVGGQNVVQESLDSPGLADFSNGTPATAFALVGRAAWLRLGGYATDVNLPGLKAGYNELDFYARAVKAGLAIRTVPEPLVYYRMRPGQLHLSTTARHSEAMDLIYAKHPEIPRVHQGGKKP